MRRNHRQISVLAAVGSCVLSCGVAWAQPTPPQPASAQPTLPQSIPGSVPLSSVLLGGGASGGARKALVVRKHAARPHRHFARVRRLYARGDLEPLERPALAGVRLVAPIPHPIQPPHFTVAVPAYPPENFITYYTTPPPPVICHHVRRDPDPPDPQLRYEKPVICEADNP